MPAPTTPIHPRLAFMWEIEFSGLRAGRAQAVQLPTEETEEVLQQPGGLSYDLKTGGRYKIGDLVLENMVPADELDTWEMDKLFRVRNPSTNTGSTPAQYYETVTIKHLDGAGNIAQIFKFEGVWIKSVAPSKNEGTSEKFMYTVTCSVNRKLDLA